jgi:hypothetical protein
MQALPAKKPNTKNRAFQPVGAAFSGRCDRKLDTLDHFKKCRKHTKTFTAEYARIGTYSMPA